MLIFTPTELNEAAHKILREFDADATLLEWFLIAEKFVLSIVVLYKRGEDTTSVYCLFKVLLSFPEY